MERPIRVLHVVGSLDRGGAETWALQMLREMDRSRYRMDFLVHSGRQFAYTEEVRALGANILCCAGARQPWRYWANFKSLYAQYGPYDILHSHVYLYSGLVLAMGAQLGIPARIAHVYPAVEDLKPASAGRLLYRYCMLRSIARNATYVLSCSQTSLQAFLQRCEVRTPHRAVLNTAVDLKAYQKRVDREAVLGSLGIPGEWPVITYVARFAAHKNHDQLIRIADRVNGNGVRAHFVMVGSHGSELERMRGLAAGRPYVSMLTALADVSELLLASDVFFFPSLEEGFGIVAIEAAAAGLLVIAADQATVREACAPSHRELMFAPNDDGAALERIERVLGDAELRKKLRADAIEWAGRFSVEASREALMKVYEVAARG